MSESWSVPFSLYLPIRSYPFLSFLVTKLVTSVSGARGEYCPRSSFRGRLPDFATDLRESFRHNRPWEGEGGRRDTKTIQCRADCGGTQAGGDGAPRCRPHPPPRDCGADVRPVEAAVGGTGIGTGSGVQTAAGRDHQVEARGGGLVLEQSPAAGRPRKTILRPSRRRSVVRDRCTAYAVSERRACRTVRCARATYY